jgi:hypothetical protein
MNTQESVPGYLEHPATVAPLRPGKCGGYYQVLTTIYLSEVPERNQVVSQQLNTTPLSITMVTARGVSVINAVS